MTLSTMLSTMSVGMLRTCGIFILTLVGSLPLGMIVALLRKSRFSVVRGIIRVYISVIRGTPLMLQLLVWYFGPYYLFDLSIRGWRFPALILGFILNYAAYFAEIYRGGIQSIPRGQYEAAEVLGYSKSQTFMTIVLPQVIKRIIPAMGNEIITLVKDTSLAFVLGIMEMFTTAKAIAASQVSMLPYAVAAAIYWGFTLFAEALIGRVEKKLSYYHD